MIDPAELTFESLQAFERSRGGPAWRAAIDAGVDGALLLANLQLTPEERLAQLDAMLQFISEIRR